MSSGQHDSSTLGTPVGYFVWSNAYITIGLNNKLISVIPMIVLHMFLYGPIQTRRVGRKVGKMMRGASGAFVPACFLSKVLPSEVVCPTAVHTSLLLASLAPSSAIGDCELRCSVRRVDLFMGSHKSTEGKILVISIPCLRLFLEVLRNLKIPSFHIFSQRRLCRTAHSASCGGTLRAGLFCTHLRVDQSHKYMLPCLRL